MKIASVTALIAAAVFMTMTGTLGAEELFTGSLYRMGTDRGELLFLQYNDVENDGGTVRIAHRYALSDGTPYAVEEVVAGERRVQELPRGVISARQHGQHQARWRGDLFHL